MRYRAIIFLCFSFFAIPALGPAQVASGPGLGLIPNSTYTHGDIDSVNISNQNLVVHIPLVTLPQRGKLPPLNFSLVANSEALQQGLTCDTDDNCVVYETYTGMGGAPSVAVSSNLTPTMVYTSPIEYSSLVDDDNANGRCESISGDPDSPVLIDCAWQDVWYWDYNVPDETGAEHSMLVDSASVNGPPFVLRATDGSGYSFVTDFPVVYTPAGDIGNTITGTLYDINGISYTTDIGNQSVSYGGLINTTVEQDPAGNSITYQNWSTNPQLPASTSNPVPLYVDSIGRTIQDPNVLANLASYQWSFNGVTGNVSNCPNLGMPSQPVIYAFTWNVPGPNGQTESLLFCYTLIVYHTGFNGLGPIDNTTWPWVAWNGTLIGNEGDNPSTGAVYSVDVVGSDNVLQSVVMPNQKAWSFVYDSAGINCCGIDGDNMEQTVETTGIPITYGTITELRYPTGAKIDYTYANYVEGINSTAYSAMHTVATRSVNDGDGNTSTTTYTPAWDYSFVSDGYSCPAQSVCVVETSALDTPLQNDTMHVYAGFITDPFLAVASPFSGAVASDLNDYVLYETQAIHYSGTAGSAPVLATTNTQYQYVWGGVGQIDPLPATITTSTPAGAINMEQKSYPTQFTGNEYYCIFTGEVGGYSYSCPLDGTFPNIALNLVQDDVVTDGLGNPLSGTATTFQYSVAPAYASASMFSLPYSVTVTGPGSDSSETIYGYDENNGSPQGVYGNQTSIHNVVNGSGAALTSTAVYNSQAMPVTTTDPDENSTIITYDTAGMFPREIQHPGAAHVDYYLYDDNTGNLQWHTDWNGSGPNDPAHTTTNTYDNLGRLTNVLYPPTQSGQGQAMLCYTDEGGSICPAGSAPFSTYASTLASPDPTINAHVNYDGLGRPIQTTAASGATSETFYDALGRIASVTNPHFTSSSTTDGSTSFTYDALGRKLTETHHPDGTYLQWSYSGTTTTATDEAGKSTQLTTDGLGRLIQIVEPGSLTTNYTYDGLGNLLTVGQLGNGTTDTPRSRTFAYDMLSRLVTASNPETGTVSYTYSVPGSICAGDASSPCGKTDARHVTTSYVYDALNRVLSRSYSDGATPSSCYQYDSSTVTNGIGLLANEWTLSASSGASCPTPTPFLTKRSILAYDPMGRLLSEQQYTPSSIKNGKSYPMSYSYDLAGNLTSSTAGAAPAQMTVSSPTVPCGVAFPTTFGFVNCYDAAGRLLNVTSNTSSSPAALFTAQGYAPFGGLANATYGGSAVSLTRTYDSRLRFNSETDTGNSPPSGTNGTALVTITGMEQSQ